MNCKVNFTGEAAMQIEIPDEFIDEIIVTELKRTWDASWEYQMSDDEHIDTKYEVNLRKAIGIVLQYYMSPTDYKQWENLE